MAGSSRAGQPQEGGGLDRPYRRIGNTDESRAELATAVALLREMGMAFWLPEAERELAGASD